MGTRQCRHCCGTKSIGGLRPACRVYSSNVLLATRPKPSAVKAEAEQWLDRPAIGLEHHKPIDLLRTHPGTRLVSEYLTRIEHGVDV